MKIPSVAVIGSCRVYTPINLMADAGELDVVHHNFEWYTHSTRDAQQKLDIIRCRRTLEDAYIPLVISDMRKFKPQTHDPHVLDNAEIIILEICSAQLFLDGGYSLQQWRVRDVLANEGVDERSRQIAQRALNVHMSEDEIVAEIVDLHESVDRLPLLLVTHNMIKRPDGSVPGARKIIRKAVEKASDRDGIFYFDPTMAIEDYGPEKALKDPAHYTKDFESVLGKALVSEIRKCLG